jgi:hypothetical protein
LLIGCPRCGNRNENYKRYHLTLGPIFADCAVVSNTGICQENLSRKIRDIAAKNPSSITSDQIIAKNQQEKKNCNGQSKQFLNLIYLYYLQSLNHLRNKDRRMAAYMPPIHMPLESKWRHYPTYIYDRNYGYGMNYYQPMIDYMDNKRLLTGSTLPESEKRIELPELPWSDGRLLWQDRRVQPYTRDDLIRHAIDAEDGARDHLSRFKVRQ